MFGFPFSSEIQLEYGHDRKTVNLFIHRCRVSPCLLEGRKSLEAADPSLIFAPSCGHSDFGAQTIGRLAAVMVMEVILLVMALLMMLMLVK
jgi:hypothetical protein